MSFEKLGETRVMAEDAVLPSGLLLVSFTLPGMVPSLLGRMKRALFLHCGTLHTPGNCARFLYALASSTGGQSFC